MRECIRVTRVAVVHVQALCMLHVYDCCLLSVSFKDASGIISPLLDAQA